MFAPGVSSVNSNVPPSGEGGGATRDDAQRGYATHVQARTAMTQRAAQASEIHMKRAARAALKQTNKRKTRPTRVGGNGLFSSVLRQREAVGTALVARL